MILFALLGCGPTVDEGTTDGSGSGSASDSDPGSTSEVATSSTGVDSDASASVGVTTSASSSGSSSGGVCQGICFVDFPCVGNEANCLDTQTIQLYETISCQRAIEEGIVFDCDPDCCEGSSCAPAMTVGCEPQTSCVETVDGPECRPDAEVCNLTDRPCGPMQFCEFGPMLCPELTDPLGMCVDVGDPCPEPMDGDSECGCDGVTYRSACERRNAGVALNYVGACF